MFLWKHYQVTQAEDNSKACKCNVATKHGGPFSYSPVLRTATALHGRSQGKINRYSSRVTILRLLNSHQQHNISSHMFTLSLNRCFTKSESSIKRYSNTWIFNPIPLPQWMSKASWQDLRENAPEFESWHPHLWTLFNKHLLKSFSVPGTVPDPGEKEENRTDMDVGHISSNLWASACSLKMGKWLPLRGGGRNLWDSMCNHRAIYIIITLLIKQHGSNTCEKPCNDFNSWPQYLC